MTLLNFLQCILESGSEGIIVSRQKSCCSVVSLFFFGVCGKRLLYVRPSALKSISHDFVKIGLFGMMLIFCVLDQNFEFIVTDRGFGQASKPLTGRVSFVLERVRNEGVLLFRRWSKGSDAADCLYRPFIYFPKSLLLLLLRVLQIQLNISPSGIHTLAVTQMLPKNSLVRRPRQLMSAKDLRSHRSS